MTLFDENGNPIGEHGQNFNQYPGQGQQGNPPQEPQDPMKTMAELAATISKASTNSNEQMVNLGKSIGEYIREARAEDDEKPIPAGLKKGLIDRNQSLPDELNIDKQTMKKVIGLIRHRDFQGYAKLIKESTTHEQCIIAVLCLSVKQLKSGEEEAEEAIMDSETCQNFITKAQSYRQKLPVKEYGNAIGETVKISKPVADPDDEIFYPAYRRDILKNFNIRLEMNFLMAEQLKTAAENIKNQLKEQMPKQVFQQNYNGQAKGKGKKGKGGKGQAGAAGPYNGGNGGGGGQQGKVCFRLLEGGCNYRGNQPCWHGAHPRSQSELSYSDFQRLQEQHQFLRGVAYGSWWNGNNQGVNNNNSSSSTVNNDANANNNNSNVSNSNNTVKGKGKGGAANNNQNQQE